METEPEKARHFIEELDFALQDRVSVLPIRDYQSATEAALRIEATRYRISQVK